MAKSAVKSPNGPESESSGRFQVFEEDPEPLEISEDDLKEYAKRIGIDWDSEQHLISIAVEGLKSRLPTGWKPCFDTVRNQWFYFNGETGTSQWEHPLDSHFRKIVERARQGSAAGRGDNSVSSSSQRDTCDDVKDIVDDASSVLVEEGGSSSSEDATPILRVDLGEKDRSTGEGCDVPVPLVKKTPASDQEDDNKPKTVTERLLAKLSARGNSVERLDEDDDDCRRNKSSLGRDSSTRRNSSLSPSSPKGILKKLSTGETSAAYSVSEQGSNASKSVRFQLDRQTSLEIKFCPSEITEEDCSGEEEDLEEVPEEEEGEEDDDEEEDEESETRCEDRRAEQSPAEPMALKKPIGALGKSPLSPIGLRSSSPLAGVGVGSPGRKPPARLNPLTPLGKIGEAKPDGAGQLVLKQLPPKNASAATAPKPAQPAQAQAQPRPQSQPQPKKPDPVPLKKPALQQQKESLSDQPAVKPAQPVARKLGSVGEDDEEKARRLSAIEKELKEAEREKALQKADESWERKKEKLVRRKSFEIEAIEKTLEQRKATELRRVSDECERELFEKQAAMRRENELRLDELRRELLVVEQRARDDLEDLRTRTAAENAERLSAVRRSFDVELERLRAQLSAEQRAELDGIRREREAAVVAERGKLAVELAAERDKADVERRALEGRLRELRAEAESGESESRAAAEAARSKLEAALAEERGRFESRTGEMQRKLEEFERKEASWLAREGQLQRREEELLERERDLTRRLGEVESEIATKSERVTQLERILLEKEDVLQGVCRERQAAAEELARVRSGSEAAERERAEARRKLADVEARYARLKAAIRTARDRRDACGGRAGAEDGDVPTSSSLSSSPRRGQRRETEPESRNADVVAAPLKPAARRQVAATAVDDDAGGRGTGGGPPPAKPSLRRPDRRDEVGREPGALGRTFPAADKLVQMIKSELRKIPRDPRTEGLKNLVKLFDRGEADAAAGTGTGPGPEWPARTRSESRRRREAWASPDNGLASSLSSGASGCGGGGGRDASPPRSRCSSAVSSTNTTASSSSAASSPVSGVSSSSSSCPTSPAVHRRRTGTAAANGGDWDDLSRLRRRFNSGSSGVGSLDFRGGAMPGYARADGGGANFAGPEEPYVWYEGVRLSPETGQLVARADKLSREFALRSVPGGQPPYPSGAAPLASPFGQHPQSPHQQLFLPSRRFLVQQHPPSFSSPSLFTGHQRHLGSGTGHGASSSSSSSDLGRRIAEHQAWLDRFTARRSGSPGPRPSQN